MCVVRYNIFVSRIDKGNKIMQQWIIPCNIKDYDVRGAFQKLRYIDWKQSNKSIEIGDEVFIYITSPVKAIQYKCKVNKVNLEYTQINDSEFVLNGESYENYGNYMELELLEEFDIKRYSLQVLREKGLRANIQGPMRAKGLLE